MPQVTRLRVVGAAIAAGALTLGSLATATAAQAANPRRAIAHTHPAWAVPAKRLSQAATAGTVNARVYLAPNNQAKLASDVAAVSTPGSSSYRHFMSASAVRTEFAPSAAEVASVKSWLTSAGLSVTSVSAKYPAGAYIGVRGIRGRRQQGVRRDVRHVPRPGRPERPGAQPGGHRARRPSPARSSRSPAWTPRRARSSRRCRSPARTTGSPSRARPTTARRSRPTSPRRTASTSPGRTAATRPARSAGPTG